MVAFNCSQPEVMEAAVREAVPMTTLPVGVYANSFVTDSHAGRLANEGLTEVRDDVTPEAYLDWATRWVDAGATIDRRVLRRRPRAHIVRCRRNSPDG